MSWRALCSGSDEHILTLIIFYQSPTFLIIGYWSNLKQLKWSTYRNSFKLIFSIRLILEGSYLKFALKMNETETCAGSYLEISYRSSSINQNTMWLCKSIFHLHHRDKVTKTNRSTIKWWLLCIYFIWNTP